MQAQDVLSFGWSKYCRGQHAVLRLMRAAWEVTCKSKHAWWTSEVCADLRTAPAGAPERVRRMLQRLAAVHCAQRCCSLPLTPRLHAIRPLPLQHPQLCIAFLWRPAAQHHLLLLVPSPIRLPPSMLFLLQRPQLCVAVPVAASGAAPAHLLLNALPFMEDFRDYKFPSFTKKAWWVPKPTIRRCCRAGGAALLMRAQ